MGQICIFLRRQRGFRIPSSAAFGQIGKQYEKAIHKFALEGSVQLSFDGPSNEIIGQAILRHRALPITLNKMARFREEFSNTRLDALLWSVPSSDHIRVQIPRFVQVIGDTGQRNLRTWEYGGEIVERLILLC